MSTIENTASGVIFTPTPYEKIKNDMAKKTKKEHRQLMIDVEFLMNEYHNTQKIRATQVRRSKGGY